MGTKYGSLAIDDARDFDEFTHIDSDFEPQLKVIVNAHYINTSGHPSASQDAVQVRGSITISF